MSQPRTPKTQYAAVRERFTPSAGERQRVGSAIDQAILRGDVSPTVLRIDADMAQAAAGRASEMSLSGSSMVGRLGVLASKVVPVLLVGASLAFLGWHTESRRFEASHPGPQPADVGATAWEGRPDPAQALPPSPDPGAEWQKTMHAVMPDPAEEPRDPHPARARSRGELAAPHALHRTHADANSGDDEQARDTTAPERHHLAEELHLMRAASAALEVGDAQAALRALAEHGARFPEGALAHERSALRVIAMCQQSKSPRALAERDRFLALHPRSPLVSRVRGACELSP